MRILIVEDESSLRETLQATLEAELFAVDVAEDAEKGSFLARTNDYDLILLDYFLPKGNGRMICDEIRKSGKAAYIILLTVKTDIETKVELLNHGADDYVVKPFLFEELLARIRAISRRPRMMTSEILCHHDLRLDIRNCKLLRGQKEIYLTRKEFMLLEHLLRHKGMVVSRSMLIEHVWDSHLDPFSNTIESHVLSLRRKIDRKNRPSMIQTVPGRGYRMYST